MRDLYHNVLVSQHLNPVNATTTKTSTTIDLKGYNSLTVVISAGISADTLNGSVYWTAKLQHSDDDSSYADVTTSDLNNASATAVLDSMSKDETLYTFGYVGAKRYVQAVVTATGSHSSGMPLAITALRGKAAYVPVL